MQATSVDLAVTADRFDRLIGAESTVCAGLARCSARDGVKYVLPTYLQIIDRPMLHRPKLPKTTDMAKYFAELYVHTCTVDSR